MATTSSCNFHPYSEACSCYRCYKSRSVMPKPDYHSCHRSYGRREADSFGEVSRGLGEPARLTSGGIRATRHQNFASAPTPLSKASTGSSKNRLEKYLSCETGDELFDEVMCRLEPKIELLVERTYAEILRQYRELKQEKVTALEKVEKELQPLIVVDDGDSKKVVEREATPVLETTITPVLALSAGEQQREDEQEPTDASLQHSNLAENVPVQMQRIEAVPTRPLLEIPSHSLNVNSTRETNFRKPLSSLTSTTETSMIARLRNLRFQQQGKLDQRRLLLFMCRKRQSREGFPPYHPSRVFKEQTRLSQFTWPKFCIYGLRVGGPKEDKLMGWLTMKYIGHGKKRIHSLFIGVTIDLVIARKYEDFEDSRSNPFEEGEYDVILVSSTKLRARIGNIAWPEVLSWLKK